MDQRLTKIRKGSGQSGSAMFFVAAFVLPLLAFLISLALDITVYFADQRKTQIVLDEAALYSYHFLPYPAEARSAAENYLKRFGGIAEGLVIDVGRDAIALTVRRNNSFTFAQLFSALLGHDIKLNLPLAVQSIVRGRPVDAFIAVDTSRYLSPDVHFGTAWGEIGTWPAATFFEKFHPISFDGELLQPRLLTQQCFNPAISAVKRAAIYAYDYLTSFGLNGVGLGFYPGSGVVIDLARPVGPLSLTDAQADRANFPLYQHPLASSEYCAAAAELETACPQYQFVGRSVRLPQERVDRTNQPANLVEPGLWRLNPDYLPYLRTEQVVWSRAVHQDQEGDFGLLLGELWTQLVGADYQPQRSSLASTPRRLAIVISGDLPQTSGYRFPTAQGRALLATALTRLSLMLTEQKRDLTIWFVLVKHSGYPGPDCDSEFLQFKAFLEEIEEIAPDQPLTIEPFGCIDPEMLLTVLADLLVRQRAGLIAR